MHRHLDTNGDGCVSEGELKQALGDLGFGGAAGAAAQEMVSEVASHSDGVTLPDFLRFVKKVGDATMSFHFYAICEPLN